MKIYQEKRKRHRSKTRSNKHDFKLGVFLYRIFLIVISIAVIISYLAAYINPETIYFPIFFGLYSIPIFILNIIILIWGIGLHRKGTIITIIVMLPALLFSDTFYKIGKEDVVAEGNKIKMTTYNVGRFSSGAKGESYSRTLERIIDMIDEENSDIVCLQEFQLMDTSKIEALFHEYTYYHFGGFHNNKSGDFGNITLSKFPIENSGEIKYENRNLCIFDDIVINQNTIRFYNCHLESNCISFTNFIKTISKHNSEISDEVVHLHEKIGERTLNRVTQVASLNNDISSCCLESIICGDFNDTPTSYTYHSLLAGHKDTFVESGTGFSATYSTFWPLLRIDYILIPSDYTSSNHKVSRPPYSDHYPVTTNIYITKH